MKVRPGELFSRLHVMLLIISRCAILVSPFAIFRGNSRHQLKTSGWQVSQRSSSSSSSSDSSASGYDFGIGKNQPLGSNKTTSAAEKKRGPGEYWAVSNPVVKPEGSETQVPITSIPTTASEQDKLRLSTSEVLLNEGPRTTRRMVAHDQESAGLRAALWDEQHYDKEEPAAAMANAAVGNRGGVISSDGPPRPAAFYPNIDLSIPESVYKEGEVDLVWDLLRWEAHQEAQREPLLVSFLYSTILNHASLESSLSFMLANRLQSPAMMISTQLQSIIYNALQTCPVFRRALRADIMAFRDRDPAVNALPDVFLYFKGFHALQSHRVANSLWRQQNKRILAQYLQAQVSQSFQIDIHPNATFGSGIMLDHGTGIVVGETASVGHNCSILHHVTLGGSGKKGIDRHPRVGDGVLLGAGSTVLGPVDIGSGSQVGAGTLVISSIPAHSVAVGVPARIIGSFVDVTEQPSIGMDHVMAANKHFIDTHGSDGI